MKFISTHVRLLEDQYEWLRRYCFENQVSQAEVIRVALEMFREKKEDKRNEDLGENRLHGERNRI
jgi:hypothetical protein